MPLTVCLFGVMGEKFLESISRLDFLSSADCLRACFIWNESPQGHEYWSAVCRGLREGSMSEDEIYEAEKTFNSLIETDR